MTQIPSVCDCVVIGGGPAGATTAALVAATGFSTVLLEQDKAPRRRPGASLLPICREALKRLGLLEAMARPCFLRKPGMKLADCEAAVEHSVCYCSEPDMGHAWQAPRIKFDELLFGNAAAAGASCFREATVLEVLFDGARARGVCAQLANGDVAEVMARVVVDASGRQALLTQQLGLQRSSAEPRRRAIYGVYRGAARETGSERGATLLFQSQDRASWFWFIPLSDNLASVGVIGSAEVLSRGSQAATAFEEALVKCPAVARRLMEAELISPLRTAGEFCYGTRQAAGPGWVMVGESLAGVDPLFSAGPSLAMVAGSWAADAIIESLRQDSAAPESLGRWCAAYQAGLDRLQRLADVFYSDRFHVHCLASLEPPTRHGLSRLLMGDVFRPDYDAALDALEQQFLPDRSAQGVSSSTLNAILPG